MTNNQTGIIGAVAGAGIVLGVTLAAKKSVGAIIAFTILGALGGGFIGMTQFGEGS